MCCTPAASMSTVASMASWRTGTVGAGARARSWAGASPEYSPAATAARTSASVRMPIVSSGIATSNAWTWSSPSRWAAERRVSAASA